MPLEPHLSRHLIMLAKAWCDATGYSMTTAAARSHCYGYFFLDLERRAGNKRSSEDRTGSFTIRKYDELVRHFNDLENWPEGTKASDIPRLKL